MLTTFDADGCVLASLQAIALVAGESDAGARPARPCPDGTPHRPRARRGRPVGRGGLNSEIAQALKVSVATVKEHVSQVLAKLEVDNRVQVALVVREAGTGGMPGSP